MHEIPIIPVILAITETFGMFTLGWLARYAGYFNDKDIDRWSRFLIDWLFSLLIFYSIVHDFEPDRLKEFWSLPLLGFGIIFFGALAGFVLKWGLATSDSDIIKTFQHFCAINNYGFLPIIIIQKTMGTKGLALLFFLTLGSQIAFWTIGIGLLGERNIKGALKNILTPSLLALFLALFVSFTGLKNYIPDIFLNICKTGGEAYVPVILIIIGASLYGTKILKNLRDIIYLTIVRLVLLPFFTIMIIKLFHFSSEVYYIAVIVSLMPVAVTTTIFARRYGGSPDYAMSAAIITTFVSIITIPLGLYFAA